MGCLPCNLTPGVGKPMRAKWRRPSNLPKPSDLPDDVLLRIAKHVPPRTLLNLMLTCKHVHRVLLPIISTDDPIVWREDMEKDWQVRRDFATTCFDEDMGKADMNISALVRNLTVWAPGHTHDPELGDPTRSLWAYTRKVLVAIPEGSLSSFGWNIGCCVPAQLFGKNGWLAKNHPHLHSMGIAVHDHRGAENLGGLIQLDSLRHISWEGPGKPEYFGGLVNMLQVNRAHLNTVQIMFHPGVRCSMVDTRILAVESGLFAASSVTLFRSIRHLALANVALDVTMESSGVVLPLSQLESLRLINCSGIVKFLRSVNDQKVSKALKLESFEITHSPDRLGPDGLGQLHHKERLSETDILVRSFLGLEELYVRSLDPWAHCSCFNPFAVWLHRGTLKRFVFDGYHDGVRNGAGVDWDDWSIQLFRSMQTAVSKLECVGISVIPWDMCRFFEACAMFQHFKLLRLRITAAFHGYRDLMRNLCEAGLPKKYFPRTMQDDLEGVRTDTQEISEVPLAIPRIPQYATSIHDGRMLNMRVFLHFAAVAFGPQGFRNLQLLVFGDFASKAHEWSRIILYRHPHPTRIRPSLGFRVMHHEDKYRLDQIAQSHEFLRMCIIYDIDDSLASNVLRYETDDTHDENQAREENIEIIEE